MLLSSNPAAVVPAAPRRTIALRLAELGVLLLRAAALVLLLSPALVAAVLLLG